MKPQPKDLLSLLCDLFENRHNEVTVQTLKTQIDPFLQTRQIPLKDVSGCLQSTMDWKQVVVPKTALETIQQIFGKHYAYKEVDNTIHLTANSTERVIKAGWGRIVYETIGKTEVEPEPQILPPTPEQQQKLDPDFVEPPIPLKLKYEGPSNLFTDNGKELLAKWNSEVSLMWQLCSVLRLTKTDKNRVKERLKVISLFIERIHNNPDLAFGRYEETLHEKITLYMSEVTTIFEPYIKRGLEKKGLTLERVLFSEKEGEQDLQQSCMSAGIAVLDEFPISEKTPEILIGPPVRTNNPGASETADDKSGLTALNHDLKKQTEEIVNAAPTEVAKIHKTAISIGANVKESVNKNKNNQWKKYLSAAFFCALTGIGLCYWGYNNYQDAMKKVEKAENTLKHAIEAIEKYKKQKLAYIDKQAEEKIIASQKKMTQILSYDNDSIKTKLNKPNATSQDVSDFRQNALNKQVEEHLTEMKDLKDQRNAIISQDPDAAVKSIKTDYVQYHNEYKNQLEAFESAKTNVFNLTTMLVSMKESGKEYKTVVDEIQKYVDEADAALGALGVTVTELQKMQLDNLASYAIGGWNYDFFIRQAKSSMYLMPVEAARALYTLNMDPILVQKFNDLPRELPNSMPRGFGLSIAYENKEIARESTGMAIALSAPVLHKEWRSYLEADAQFKSDFPELMNWIESHSKPEHMEALALLDATLSNVQMNRDRRQAELNLTGDATKIIQAHWIKTESRNIQEDLIQPVQERHAQYEKTAEEMLESTTKTFYEHYSKLQASHERLITTEMAHYYTTNLLGHLKDKSVLTDLYNVFSKSYIPQFIKDKANFFGDRVLLANYSGMNGFTAMDGIEFWWRGGVDATNPASYALWTIRGFIWILMFGPAFTALNRLKNVIMATLYKQGITNVFKQLGMGYLLSTVTNPLLLFSVNCIFDANSRIVYLMSLFSEAITETMKERIFKQEGIHTWSDPWTYSQTDTWMQMLKKFGLFALYKGADMFQSVCRAYRHVHDWFVKMSCASSKFKWLLYVILVLLGSYSVYASGELSPSQMATGAVFSTFVHSIHYYVHSFLEKLLNFWGGLEDEDAKAGIKTAVKEAFSENRVVAFDAAEKSSVITDYNPKMLPENKGIPDLNWKTLKKQTLTIVLQILSGQLSGAIGYGTSKYGSSLISKMYEISHPLESAEITQKENEMVTDGVKTLQSAAALMQQTPAESLTKGVNNVVSKATNITSQLGGVMDERQMAKEQEILWSTTYAGIQSQLIEAASTYEIFKRSVEMQRIYDFNTSPMPIPNTSPNPIPSFF